MRAAVCGSFPWAFEVSGVGHQERQENKIYINLRTSSCLELTQSREREHQLSVLFLYNITNMKGRNNFFVCWTRTHLLRAMFTSRVIMVDLIRAIQRNLLLAALSPKHHTNSNSHSSALGSASKAATYQPDRFSSRKISLMHSSTACF